MGGQGTGSRKAQRSPGKDSKAVGSRRGCTVQVTHFALKGALRQLGELYAETELLEEPFI